jgi:hypothetical protein
MLLLLLLLSLQKQNQKQKRMPAHVLAAARYALHE